MTKRKETFRGDASTYSGKSKGHRKGLRGLFDKKVTSQTKNFNYTSHHFTVGTRPGLSSFSIVANQSTGTDILQWFTFCVCVFNITGYGVIFLFLFLLFRLVDL